MALLGRVHSPRYLDFLQGAWREWIALDPANAELDVLPSVSGRCGVSAMT